MSGAVVAQDAPRRRGKPTTYKGVHMRSRTEAKIAALMDEFGWQWHYEPTLELDRYIPDFLVRFGNQDCIIEVKATDEDFSRAKDKIERSGWTGMAIIIAPTLDGDCAGMFRDWDGVEWQWGELGIMQCSSWECISPFQIESSWHCRCCGARDCHMQFEVREAYAKATNRVQWAPEVDR